MYSLILSTTARFLLPLLLLFSLFLLLRGHNHPGGGFAGGLVAATAFALYGVAFGVPAAQRLMRLEPQVIIGAGLLVALASGVWSLLAGRPFLTGSWGALHVPGVGVLSLGTPLFFDLGVYLVVLGVAVLDVFALAEEAP